VEWVVREGVGAGGRNDPSLVCTYELKKKKKKKRVESDSPAHLPRLLEKGVQLAQ
jgi:hypothetical protein